MKYLSQNHVTHFYSFALFSQLPLPLLQLATLLRALPALSSPLLPALLATLAPSARVQLDIFSQLPDILAYTILVAPSPGVQLPLSLDAQTQVFLGAEVQLPFGA